MTTKPHTSAEVAPEQLIPFIVPGDNSDRIATVHAFRASVKLNDLVFPEIASDLLNSPVALHTLFLEGVT